METPRRTFIKALTWQLTGLVTMSVVGFLLTGSLGAAGGFAVLSAAIGFAMFFVHERIWAGIAWGLRDRPARSIGRAGARRDDLNA